MRRVVLGLSFGLVWAASATAVAAPPTPSSLFLDGLNASMSTGQAVVSGHIETPKVNCLSGRKVDVYFSYENSSEFGRVDRGISSGNGAFAGTGPATDISSNPVDQVMLKLKKKKYGRGHSKTCAAAAIAVS